MTMTPREIQQKFSKYVEEHEAQDKAYLSMPTHQARELVDCLATKDKEIARLRTKLGIAGKNRHSGEEE